MRLRTLFLWHLASSILFVVGSLILTIGYICFRLHFQDGLDPLFGSLEGLGWVLLTLHVLPEVVVDMNTFPGRSRRIAHLRYGPTPYCNLAQSFCFATACFFQGSYNVSQLYQDGNQSDELTTILNLIAGNFWILSGLLAVTSLGFRSCCCCCGTSRRLGIGEQFMIDVYIVTTLILCLTAYLETFAQDLTYGFLQEYGVNESLDVICQFAIRCVWSFLGLGYVTGDIITISSPRSRKSEGLDSPLGAMAPDAEYA